MNKHGHKWAAGSWGPNDDDAVNGIDAMNASPLRVTIPTAVGRS